MTTPQHPAASDAADLTQTAGTFEDPPARDPDDGSESIIRQAAPEPETPLEDDPGIQASLSDSTDPALREALDEPTFVLADRPEPTLSTPGRVTLAVAGRDRTGLVEAIVEALRGYRPDITGWMITMAARGIVPVESGQTVPSEWRADVDADPVPAGLVDLVTAPARGDNRERFYLEVACPNCPVDGHGRPTRTGWAVEPITFGDRSVGAPYALAVVPTGPDQHVDQSDARWLQGVVSRELTGQHPIAREEALVEALADAVKVLRDVREFVDPTGSRLPAVAGWSWFDWLTSTQGLIRGLGFTNDGEWHPETDEAPAQVHVPAPPVAAAPAPAAAVDEFAGVWSKRGRPGNGDDDITETGLIPATRPAQQTTTSIGLLPVPVPADPSEARRTSGETVAVARREPRPPREPGRLRSAVAAWRAAGKQRPERSLLSD